MSDTVQLALIAGAGPFLVTCVTAFLQLRHGWKVQQVAEAIKVVEHATNGMKDQLVAVTRSDATQIERARGAAEVKDRNDAAKDQLIERRKQPMVPLVAVPIETPPEIHETHYVIRGGQLVALPKP